MTAEKIIQVEEQLCEDLDKLAFIEPVAYIYNPLVYAKEPHDCYIQKYCNSQKDVLFLGMNPGPFGMAQTGVPFGEVNFVRDWLGIEGVVVKPVKEHPKRPILGLECQRSEVSGRRFWGWLQELCETPTVLFSNCTVYNYCPLAFMSKSGKNITLPQLKVASRAALYDLCDQSLKTIFELLQPKVIIAVGKFAFERTKVIVSRNQLSVRVISILHPSPANPQTNKGWSTIVSKQLQDYGLLHVVKGSPLSQPKC